MAQIHPSSIVDPHAQLADDAIIGPWCHLEGRVTIGPGTHLMHRVTLRGPIRIGQGNVLYPGVCLGLAPQSLRFDPNEDGPGVVVGDHNVLRENVTIHRATTGQPTSLGSHNYLMAGAHIAHDCIVGSRCLFANNSCLGGHVLVQDQVILGGSATSHQFCRIGRLALISGMQGVTQDVPPFCTCYTDRSVGSLNLIGLRRAGLRDHIKPLQRAFDLLYRKGLSNQHAVESIRRELANDPLCQELADFVSTSERGISGYRSSIDS